MPVKTTRRDFVTFREDRLATGGYEIGVFVDAVLPGASVILTAVISRQPGKNSRWCVYPYAGSARKFAWKAQALEYAFVCAYGSAAGKIHASN